MVDWRDHGQKPDLRGGGDGGGSNPWSSSTPDFSITTCARSPAGRGRVIFGWGAEVGVGRATARSGEDETSGDGPCSGAGVFAGLGVSSSSRASLAFPPVLDFPVVCFSRDFFFAAFGLGVGVWRRFDFGDAVGSGVSRGLDDGFVSSASADSCVDFALRVRGDSSGSSDSLVFAVDFSFAIPPGFGVGDFLGLGEGFLDSSPANLAFGIAVDASSGVAEACFFADLLFALFPLGAGDFFGLGEEALVSLDSDSSRRLFCPSLTCARRTPVMIAPTASAVASQMRKRTTAMERNRARDVINAYRNDFLKKLQTYKGR